MSPPDCSAWKGRADDLSGGPRPLTWPETFSFALNKKNISRCLKRLGWSETKNIPAFEMFNLIRNKHISLLETSSFARNQKHISLFETYSLARHKKNISRCLKRLAWPETKNIPLVERSSLARNTIVFFRDV